ncbi:MAG TPA: MopE-related protein, partial [Candidatus Polarisedimenticolia bacterium]|nr:MopE-related protein [Candidatus Polarisedimenticolia bacterium]
WADGYPFTNKPVVSDATCDNVDDDCDGSTDEDLAALNCGVGACHVTTPACLNGQTQSCTPGTPTAEVCDGADNDCDGSPDEDLGVITCGLGACEATVPACVNGAAGVCTPGTPGTEVCNGIDDDCDGVPDDGTQPNEATDFRFTGASAMTWTPAAGADTHNVYRGEIVEGNPWAWNEVCLQTGLTAPLALDLAVPPVGSAFYYFAVGVNACGAGTQGSDSAGAPRPAAPACP